MNEDAAGLLWVMVVVADARYAVIPFGTPADQTPPADTQYDTIVEVIDVRRNEVVASHRFNDAFRGFACERTVYACAERGNGEPGITVLNLRLAREDG